MRSNRYPSSVIDQWVTAYKAGNTLADIADAYGTYPSTVWRQLRGRGVTMRPAQRRTAPSTETVERAAASGMSQVAVAETLGTSTATVSRRLGEART